MKVRMLVVGALLVGAPIAHGPVTAQENSSMDAWGITAVPGLELGHHTLSERPTGCTVVIAREGAVGGVDVRGSSPGSREIALLDPVNRIDQVHAVVLAGGSAFGLDVGSGVMSYLDERDIGVPVGRGKVVPIVVGAILFDLGLEGDEKIRPGPECGYTAADQASSGPPAEGSVGAGMGATVGKMGRGSMRGGFGTASITLDNGLIVAAAVAVNAIGDIVDPATGEIVAGARNADGTGFIDARMLLRGEVGREEMDLDDLEIQAGMNTTIGIVATNATLTKAEATKMAQMAQDGFARTIYPSHTMGDGDTVFSLATGTMEGPANLTVIGGLAADVMSQAILRAVRMAEGLPGIPSVRDLGR